MDGLSSIVFCWKGDCRFGPGSGSGAASILRVCFGPPPRAPRSSCPPPQEGDRYEIERAERVSFPPRALGLPLVVDEMRPVENPSGRRMRCRNMPRCIRGDLSVLRKVVASVIVLTAFAGRAASQEFEGTRQFGISLWAPAVSPSTDTWVVAVTAWNTGLGPNRAGEVSIDLDGPASIVNGADRRRIPALANEPVLISWKLVLHKREIGNVTLRASMRVYGGATDSYDLHEAVLSFKVSQSEIRVIENRTTRQISVRHGRKFRYAGPALVAVESDEDTEPVQVESRAEIVQGSTILCEECELSDTVEVPVVLTVGRGGNVSWISRVGDIGGKPASSAVRSAIEKGLSRFQFRPAVAQGRPIADFVFTTLTLAPEKRK
jgi:hypothetical protein